MAHHSDMQVSKHSSNTVAYTAISWPLQHMRCLGERGSGQLLGMLTRRISHCALVHNLLEVYGFCRRGKGA